MSIEVDPSGNSWRLIVRVLVSCIVDLMTDLGAMINIERHVAPNYPDDSS